MSHTVPGILDSRAKLVGSLPFSPVLTYIIKEEKTYVQKKNAKLNQQNEQEEEK